MLLDRLTFLKTKNFNPKQIVDIGCNNGQWSQDVSYIFPTAKFFLIDANSQHEERLKNLKNLNYKYVICLLAEKEKEYNFYKSKNFSNTGDSIFKEKTSHYENCQVDLLKSKTLDLVLQENNINYVDYLKLDTQGSELLILSGAKKTLSNTEFVQLEINIQQYNENAPIFDEYIKFMKKLNFFCYDVIGLNYIDKHLVAMDLLFTKDIVKYKPKSIL